MVDLMNNQSPEEVGNTGLGTAYGFDFPVEVAVLQCAKNGHRFGMRLMEITQDVFVICCQLLCATYVGNGISQNQLGEQVSFYGSDVAHQIANGVLAGFVGPVDLVWRDYINDALRRFPNLFVVRQKRLYCLNFHSLNL